MIRPAAFGYNPETAASNVFQHTVSAAESENIGTKAIREFDRFAEKIKAAGIPLLVIDDTPEPPKPDAVFPNNWLATLPEGVLLLFPLLSPLRRLERRAEIIEMLKKHFIINKYSDWSGYEKENRFLEGTGSLVFDHKARVAYAARSPRTDEVLFLKFCNAYGYRPVLFNATDAMGKAIYHTNVMMSICAEAAIICLESMADIRERQEVKDCLLQSGKEIVEVGFNEMENFACNTLRVFNRQKKSFFLLSTRALQSLSLRNRKKLEKFGQILHSDLENIEKAGGGSARCMMAELWLESR